MKLKKSLLLFLLFFVVFIGVDKVYAELNIGIEGQTNYSLDPGKHVLNKVLYDAKNSDVKYTAYCISGVETDVAANGSTCTLKNEILNHALNKTLTADEIDEKRSVIAQIILRKCSGGCKNFGDNYLLTEAAIFEYLGVASFSNFSSEIKTIIETAKTNSTYNVYKSRDNFTVDFTVNSLTFEKGIENSTEFYMSQKIKMKGIPNVNSNGVTITVSGASGVKIVDESGNTINQQNDTTFKIKNPEQEFYVYIPADVVTKDTKITIKASATQQSSITTRLYDCGGNTQAVARIYEPEDKTGDATISGKPSATGTLEIIKTDEKGNPVSGAEIQIIGPNFDQKRTTGAGGIIRIFDLPFGTYIIKEIKAPEGYIVAKDITFTLSGSTPNFWYTAKMIDYKNKVNISKKDVTGKGELPGATLEIQNENGEIVKFCTDAKGNKGAECKWVSTNQPYVIEGVPSGKYYLVETIAPNGYVLSTEKVPFEVDENKLTTDVTMTNKLIKVEISKISVATTKELPGATLEIQDKDGKIVKYCTDEKGNKGAECKWVSTDKPYVIEGMPNGTYYLVETLAPEGYVLNTEKIEFTVDNTKPENEVIKVEMKNELEVDVPNTLSSRSALLLTIAMIDIALGIGIVTYVKKNKVTE